MTNNRITVWLACAIITLVLLALFGPWGSDSKPNTQVSEQTTNSGLEDIGAPHLEGDLKDAPALLESDAINRTDVAPPPGALSFFEVLDSNGEQVVDARVILCRDKLLLHSAISDSSGTVEYPSDGQAVLLVVVSIGRPIATFTMDLAAGRQQVVLPQGAEVSGKIIDHDGSAPGQMRLRLKSNHPLFDYSSLPNSAFEELGALINYNTISTLVEPGGLFRFRGLPESWSGSIRLTTGSKIEHTNAGEITASMNELRLEAPHSGLLMELGKCSIIKGRLIERQTSTPLGNVQISARYAPVNGQPAANVTVTTDQDGYFRLKLEPTELMQLELFFGSRPVAEHGFLNLPATELPAHGDLGDIEVDSLRQIRFRLQDSNGKAISGGYALAGGYRSSVTNPQGESSLPWVPPSITRLRFIADGFVPIDQGLNEAVPDPLVIVMTAGNRLELELIVPDGVDADQFRAELKSDSLLIAGPARDLTELLDYVGEESHPYYQPPNPTVGTLLLGRPDSDARIVFQHLRSDVELKLQILGRTGAAIYHEEILKPLGPHETRRHVIDLTQAGALFHGRVVDHDGNPLVRATVQHGNQILAWTDSSGEFSCLVNVAEPKTMVIGHQSSAALYIHDYLLPTDGAAVEFRMQPALRVILEVVDEAGTPMPSAQVFTQREGFTTNTHGLGDGRFETGGLPPDGVSVLVMLAGRNYLQDLDTTQLTAKVVVPVHGSVVVNFHPPSPPGAGRYEVIVMAMKEQPWIVLRDSVNATSGWSCEFPLVLPGEYEAQVDYHPSPQEEQAGMTTKTLDGQITIQVESGQCRQISL